jgi:hypothetical protein
MGAAAAMTNLARARGEMSAAAAGDGERLLDVLIETDGEERAEQRDIEKDQKDGQGLLILLLLLLADTGHLLPPQTVL